MSHRVEDSTDPTGTVSDPSDARSKNMSDVNPAVKVDLSSSEMTRHVKFFHESSFACSLCNTPNDENSRHISNVTGIGSGSLVQFYEIDYLSQLQNKNLSFNRKSTKSVNRREKSSSASGMVGDGALNQNERQSGGLHLHEAPSLNSNTSASRPSIAPDNEVTGLVSELPKEIDSELNGLVKSITKNNSTDLIGSNDLRSNETTKAWKEGDDCVAKWSEDGQWYKSIITEVDDEKVTVTFTDYGNSGWATKELLMPPDTVIDEKGQIMEKNVDENKNNQSGDADGVHEEVQQWKENDKCVAQWVEDGCWYRSVIEKIESPDKVLVKFIDYGNSDYTSLSNVQPFETVIDVNGQIGENIHLNESNKQCEVKDGLEVKECRVVQGEDKDGLEVQGEDKDELNEEVEQWKEGDRCVAQWVEDSCWYRSVIEIIESPDQVLVRFIDYGNSDYTILSNLKPCDTIIGEDGQIKDIEIKINDKNEKGKQYSATNTGEDGPVQIGEAGDCIDITDNFWKEGDACVAQWKEDDLWYRSVITKMESNEKVLVTFTDYGNSEYTSLEALKPRDTKIQEDGTIEEVDGSNDVAWKVDEECVAQWEKDKCWYKSKIVRIDSNENVLVEFTEYGNADYTTLAKLKPFYTEIANGQLKVATEADEKDIDESEEKYLLKVKTKCLWKVGDKCLAQWSGDQCWYKGVIILIEKDGKTLVKFIHNGNLDYTTSSDLKPLETKISVCGQAESHMRSYDTKVDYDEKFLDTTAPDIQTTSDCLQTDQENADSKASTTNDVSSKWKVGDSCVAQWRLDGHWYKSIITKIKSSGKVKVLFTEYGNSDYTSIDLLKPHETVVSVDATLADESSSGVINIKTKKLQLEPIAEEPPEGVVSKGNGNKEEQQMFEYEGHIPIAVTNKEKEAFSETDTLDTPISVESIAVDKSNNSVDTMREENDQNDLLEPKNQGQMLAPNAEGDLNGVVAPEIDANTPKQSTLMNTDSLLLESITEIYSSKVINEIEIKNSTEKPCKIYPALSPTKSISKGFDEETTTELLKINNAGESRAESISKGDAGKSNHARSPDSSDKNECIVSSKTKMDFINRLTKNTVEIISVKDDESHNLVSSQFNENQTYPNTSFGLIESLLEKSNAGDGQSAFASKHLSPTAGTSSLTNNSEFYGRVKSLAMHEEGANYLVAITNQDTVVRIQGELMTDSLPVMLHPVASKVMQAVVDVTDNLEELLQIVLENFYALSSNKSGSKIIQKILTRLPSTQKSAITAKLENEEVLTGLLSSAHGTNVAQACLLYLTERSVTSVGNFLLMNIVELGSSPNGSYFIQLFMTSSNTSVVKVFKDKVLDAIVENAEHLVRDKFGTWLAQTAAKVIESPRHIFLLSAWVKDNIMDVYCDPDAMHFASSVIEALVKISNSEETDFAVNSSKRESEKILREVIFLMTDTLVEVNGSSVPLIVASSLDPYGHVLAREVCLQARYVPEIRNKFIQVFSEYKSKLEGDTFGCLVLKGLGGLL